MTTLEALRKATTKALEKKLDKLEGKIQSLLGFDEDSEKYHSLIEQADSIEAELIARTNIERGHVIKI